MAHPLPWVTHTLPDCSHSGSWALLHLQEFLDLEMDHSFMTFCFFATSPERKFPESRTSFLLLETTELCLSQIWRTSPPSLAGCQRHIFFLLLYREPPRKDSEMSWEGNFETGKAQFNSVVNHPPIIISCLWAGIFLLWEFFLNSTEGNKGEIVLYSIWKTEVCVCMWNTHLQRVHIHTQICKCIYIHTHTHIRWIYTHIYTQDIYSIYSYIHYVHCIHTQVYRRYMHTHT